MQLTRNDLLPALSWIMLLASMVIGCRSERPLPPLPTSEPSPVAVEQQLAATAEPAILFLPLTGVDGPTPTMMASAVASPTSGPMPTTVPTPAFPFYTGPPLRSDLIGIQIHLHREDLGEIFAHLAALNVGWIKVQISWKVHEPRPGDYDFDLFQELDWLVSGARGVGIQLLLSLAKAPDWSRPTTEEDGPPSDPAHFQAFAYYVADRYQGQIAAYELWNESNLQREWRGAPLHGAEFVRLVVAGAAGIHAADPAALIISGAPAPTGINDGVTAVDDRLYLRQMVVAGLGDHVNGVGIHPYGWANPPEATAGQPDLTIPSHNDHPSFFFADTLMDYRTILDEAGLSHLPLWTTEFGWGSFDQFDTAPPPDAAFMAAVSEWQQATYTLRALEMGQQQAWMGPMFLWNLNFATTLGPDFSESGYSLLRPDGMLRPVYYSLATALSQ